MPTPAYLLNCIFKTGNKYINTEIRMAAEKKEKKKEKTLPTKNADPKDFIYSLNHCISEWGTKNSSWQGSSTNPLVGDNNVV